MKRLILTTSDSGAGCLKFADIADKVIGIGYLRSAIGSMLSIYGSIPIRTRVCSRVNFL
ncbi:MAG: hypothetical protein KGQ48_09595 [Bradyrhizobium sp.]|nr:hypothetical protein [Bradyrhizobium sp.]